MPSEITGLDEWEDLLDTVQKRTADLRPIEGAIHDSFVADMVAGGIPHKSGRLRDSLTNPGSDQHIWKADASGMSMGSRDPASIFNRRWKKGAPGAKRTWFGPEAVPEVDADAAAEILADYIFRGKR